MANINDQQKAKSMCRLTNNRNNTMKVFTSIVLITLIGLKVNGQDSMLTMGHHWTESEANIMMKKFS